MQQSPPDQIAKERVKYRRSCQPCSHRKVRCDRDVVQPCSNCLRRKHPERCDLGSEAYSRTQPHRGRERRKANSRTRRQSMTLLSRPEEHPQDHSQSTDPPTSHNNQETMLSMSENIVTPHDQARLGDLDNGTGPTPHIGEPAMATFIRHEAANTGVALTENLSTMLGLQNINDAGYPLLDLGSSADRWEQLEHMLPRPVEIWRSLPFFREGIQILNPIIADYDAFDSRICTYLEDFAVGKLKQQALDSDQLRSREFFAWIGLILAAMAAGSQCSAVRCAQRKKTTENFIFRAFHCLRMSNFLLRPTLQVVQTYSLIVEVIQNDSEADAAWALLGTVTRLAQCIGLHLQPSAEYEPSAAQMLGANAWRNLMWQDCVLSLCFGRPATSTEVSPQFPSDHEEPTDSHLTMTYSERLWHLSNLTVISLSARSTVLETREQIHKSIQRIEKLSPIHDSRAEKNQSTKARLENYGFKLYSSFVISFLCQQRLRNIQKENNDADEHTELSEKLVHSLKDSISSFLNLHTITLLPMRIWSMKHIALCSAFLLSFRCNLRRYPSLLQPVEALIDAFASAGEDTPENVHGYLSTRHARALEILREVCSRDVPQETQEKSAPKHPMSEDVPDPSNETGFSEMVDIDGSLQGPVMQTFDAFAAFDGRLGTFWDDDFFSLLTGNANITSHDAFDGFRAEPWN